MPASSKHNDTSFKPGNIPWNKKIKYNIICKNCNKEFSIPFYRKEIAHIIPAKDGGELSEKNTLGLCPNHHHLFDNKKLLFEETTKLKDKVINYFDFIKKDDNVTCNI